MFKVKHLLTYGILAVFISIVGFLPQTMIAMAASDPVAVTLDAPATVSGNAEFTVSVDISQVTLLNAANFRITFDSSLIALDSVTDGTIESTTIKVDGYKEVQPGVCNIVIFLGGITGVTGSGTLAVIHFHSLNKTGETDIKLSEGVLSDTLANEIAATWTGSSIFVNNGGTVTTSPSTGGGGGGGGGGSGVNGKTITSLRGSSSSTGVVWENIHAVSMDTKATLDIAYGTKCTNANGNALSDITITQITDPDAAQTGVTIVGTVYELGPSGANFDPPITLTIYYDEAGLPAGTQESNLTIAIWDAGSGTYKAIDYQVDTEANKITASISHFSRYTIIAVPAVTTPPAPISTTIPSPKPATVSTSTAVPVSSPTLSPTPKPAATPSPTTPAALTPAPATTTPVSDLPIEKSTTNWWLWGSIGIGAIVIVGLLVFVIIPRRRD